MSTIEDLALVRLAVSKLCSRASWTPVLGTEQVEMLRFILPRTATMALTNLSYSINAHQHDAQVGVGNYHLFRLPADVEERVRNIQQISMAWAGLLAAPPEESIKLIARFSLNTAVDYQEGPVSIGSLRELTSNGRQLLAYAACHYQTAHQQGYRTFPYLTQE